MIRKAQAKRNFCIFHFLRIREGNVQDSPVRCDMTKKWSILIEVKKEHILHMDGPWICESMF